MDIDFDLSAWGNKPFQSNAEMMIAMRRPEWRDPYNQAYRNAVENKVALMDNSGISVRVVSRNETEVTDSYAALMQNEAGKVQSENFQEAEQTLREERGPQAARPLSAVAAEALRVGEARLAEEELGRIFGSQAIRPSAPQRPNAGYDANHGYGFNTREE